MGSKWKSNREPTIEEVLEEPAIRTLMNRDRVSQEELRRHIRSVREAILSRRTMGTPVSGYQAPAPH